MQITLRTFGCAAIASLMATSSMAVLPTVALDSNAPAIALPVTSANSLPPMPTTITVPATTTRAVMPTMANTGVMPAAMPATINAVNPAISQIQKRLLASIVGRDAAGNEVLSPITAQTRIQSGQVIEYHGYVINRSPERVRNLKVTFGLPANTVLTGLPDMSPSRAYGSIDGVNFHYMPLKANIGGVLQEVPLTSYKAVRWDIQGLGLNEVAEVKYRVRVK